MWREWLGSQARIIEIDLNPEVKKWKDQGDQLFGEKFYRRLARLMRF